MSMERNASVVRIKMQFRRIWAINRTFKIVVSITSVTFFSQMTLKIVSDQKNSTLMTFSVNSLCESTRSVFIIIIS